MAVAAASENQSASFDELTDDQKAIVEMVRQFVEEQILPNAEEYDARTSSPSRSSSR